jgi:hypothetical protein
MSTPLLRNVPTVGLHFRTSDVKDRVNRYIGSAGLLAWLDAEPTNPHDPYAVKVNVRFPDGHTEHVGYIAATVSALVAAWLKGSSRDACSAIIGGKPGKAEVLITLETTEAV